MFRQDLQINCRGLSAGIPDVPRLPGRSTGPSSGDSTTKFTFPETTARKTPAAERVARRSTEVQIMQTTAAVRAKGGPGGRPPKPLDFHDGAPDDRCLVHSEPSSSC